MITDCLVKYQPRPLKTKKKNEPLVHLETSPSLYKIHVRIEKDNNVHDVDQPVNNERKWIVEAKFCYE